MSQEFETLDDAEIETDLPLPAIDEVLKDRFRIVALLGRGGSSKVFEAEHVELGLRYAVKFLRSERAGAARTRQRFAQEARLLASLEHPGIARVVDIGYYKGVTPFIALEHVAGETLRIRLRKQRQSLEQTLELMSQLCAAMASAHDKGIVHRDLKPENLMLTDRDEGGVRLRVLDFGIARTLAQDEPSLTPTGAQLGTPHYMSPEQARGEKHVGPAADVYGLGVVFYEMLSLARPHPGDSHYSVVFHLLTQEPVPLGDVAPDVPRAVRDVVERCLRRKPEERYANARELGVAIAALRAVHAPDADARAMQTAPNVIATRSWLRSPWLSALAGVMLGGYGASIVHDARTQSPPLSPEPSVQLASPSTTSEPAPALPLEQVTSSAVTASGVSTAERPAGATGEQPTASNSGPPKRAQSRPRSGAAGAKAPAAETLPGAARPSPSATGSAAWGGIVRNPYD